MPDYSALELYPKDWQQRFVLGAFTDYKLRQEPEGGDDQGGPQPPPEPWKEPTRPDDKEEEESGKDK